MNSAVMAVIGRLRPWVECESPTFDPLAVNRMMDLAAEDLRALGAEVERIPGSGGFGDCLHADFPHPLRGRVPGILAIGHLDTVHPVGTLAQLPFRLDGERCYGPGILDMKAGNRFVLEAMAALREADAQTALPVSVLFTSDEEVGSPSTRALIEERAARHRFVLVPEPAHRGGVITGRYAIARFNLTATGRPSHAGISPRSGRSAIRLMADRVGAIEDLSTDDCSYSVGVIGGGTWVNCVATTCRAEALSMAKRQADLDAGIARLMEMSGDCEGGRFDVDLGVVRPVWEPDAGTTALYETARAIAAELGHDLPQSSVGGGSDANFTGSAGIATLDGLGADGVGLHTLDEHILASTIQIRVEILKRLLCDPFTNTV